MKILKIFNDWSNSPEREKINGYGGCGYYRTIKIAEQLSPEHEVTVWGREWREKYNSFNRNNDMFFSWIAREFDMVWMHYTDNPITFSWLKAACDREGTKLVVDIDDNFLEVDKKNPALKKQNRGKLDTTNKVAMLGTILSFADAITVSTLPLKERLEEHFMTVHKIKVPIFVVPNYNDAKDWNFTPVPKKGLVIGYMGGLSHRDDLDLVLPAIKTLLKKYPHIAFQLMGQMDLKEAKKIFSKWPQSSRNRMFLMNATRTQAEFPKYLSEQPWDIGIAPLIDSPFNKSKSHIKWMEYAMYEIPTVASPRYPYAKDILGKPTIENMETGVFAENDEWVEKLSVLIENEGLRRTIGADAKQAVLKNWQYDKKYILSIVKKLEQL